MVNMKWKLGCIYENGIKDRKKINKESKERGESKKREEEGVNGEGKKKGRTKKKEEKVGKVR